MPMSTQLFSQAEQIYKQLQEIEQKLTCFLNEKSVTSIVEQDKSLNDEYIGAVIKQFRFLEVYCMEGKNALKRLIRSEPLDTNMLEKILKGIYHKCVNQFFSPKDDLWYEDSRASYCDKRSIEFQADPGDDLLDLTQQIEPTFQDLREQLDYLEAV
ncbi:hypothetical protein FHR85_001753 [Alkalibacillus almallahensis]|nr:hypothetical protein [Alkalibacillus almallahensis]